VHIGEITAPTARDADFFGRFFGMVENQNRLTGRGDLRAAKKSCCACANDEGVKYMGQSFVNPQESYRFALLSA